MNTIDLEVGQLLRNSAGTWIQVESVEVHTDHLTVYNFTVVDFHAFSVVTAGTDFLTRNCGDDEVGRDLIDGQSRVHIISGDKTGGGHKWPVAPVRLCSRLGILIRKVRSLLGTVTLHAGKSKVNSKVPIFGPYASLQLTESLPHSRSAIELYYNWKSVGQVEFSGNNHGSARIAC